MIRSCDCSYCATLERITDKAMSIDKFAIKTGAGVVFLRERKEQFARAYRTRVDGIISNLFVKYLSANACRIRAHQTCCLANLHVITASSCSIVSSCAGVLLTGSSRHSTSLESELWFIETFARTSAKLPARLGAERTSSFEPSFGG